MRVTEKGQVTIPKAIRDKLGIAPGSEVDFVDTGEVVQFERAADIGSMTGEEIEERLTAMHGTIDTNGMDGNEYVDWLRGPRDDLDPR